MAITARPRPIFCVFGAKKLRLPSLEQVAQMTDEAELNSYITHFTKPELKVLWGEPNESSTMEDVWYIDDSTKHVVNYHNNDDKAVVCSIVRTE